MGGVDRKKKKNKRGFKFENEKGKRRDEKPAVGGRRSTRQHIDPKFVQRVKVTDTQHNTRPVCATFFFCDIC